MNETRAALHIAATVPFEHLVVHIGQPDAQAPPPNDNQRDAAKRSVEEIAEAVANTPGVELALEVIPNKLSTVERIVRLIEDLELDDAGCAWTSGTRSSWTTWWT